jgi:uncharacterized protein YcfL
MTRFARLALGCAAALALGAGCRHDTSPSPGLPDPHPAPWNNSDITVLSPDLHEWIRFGSAVRTKIEGQPMQVEVPMRNLTANQYLVDYRFLYYDESGRELEPVMGWRMQPLQPKQVVTLKGKALDAAATRWRLEVKWAQQ